MRACIVYSCEECGFYDPTNGENLCKYHSRVKWSEGEDFYILRPDLIDGRCPMKLVKKIEHVMYPEEIRLVLGEPDDNLILFGGK